MAVSLTASELQTALGGSEFISSTDAARLLAVATSRVELHAVDAPVACQNEAVVRYSGYLLQSAETGYGVKREDEFGDARVEPVTNHAAAFRNSGAESLLSPYKIRRAGVVK